MATNQTRFWIVAALLFCFTSPLSYATITVSGVNHANDLTIASVRTIFFLTNGKTGDPCQVQRKYPTGRTSIDPSAATPGLEFTISTSKSLTDINGGAPGATDISIRVEKDGDNGSNIALLNKDTAYTSTPYWVNYGTTVGATVKFGISLKDIVSGATYDGLCSYLDALTGNADNCQPPAGQTPTSLNLRFGVVKTGNSFADANADKSEVIKVILGDCPAGHAAGTFTVPTPNFKLTAGDQRIKVQNETTAPTDTVIPVVGVVVYGGEDTDPRVDSNVARLNSGTGAANYIIDGLSNDKRYCFGLGYINAVGLVTTDSSWSPNLVTMPGSTGCATPSQIDGFLDRSTCFIASATYGDEWDTRLEILRQFRDQVLDRFSLGRQFTKWYYDWSPQAARWIFKNPGYRGAVQLALLPVLISAQVILWLSSNLWFFAVAIIIFTAAYLFRKQRTIS